MLPAAVRMAWSKILMYEYFIKLHKAIDDFDGSVSGNGCMSTVTLLIDCSTQKLCRETLIVDGI